MKQAMFAALTMLGCVAQLSPSAGVPRESPGTSHDGVLAGDERAHVYAMRTRVVFRRLDHNGDGKLERSEVPIALWRALADVDRDGDGAITVDEFIALHDVRAGV